MKRKLLNQIGNEWRTNLWLALELLIISVVLWYLIDSIYTMVAKRNEPLGFDTEHCYDVNLSILKTEASQNEDWDAINEMWERNIKLLLERIAARPEVEVVAMGRNAVMYNFTNNETTLRIDTLHSEGFIVQRCVTPEFVRVFRYHGLNGESPEQLEEMLRENPNGFWATNNIFESSGVKMDQLIGRTFNENSEYTDQMTLRGILATVRYHDYQAGKWSHSILVPAVTPEQMVQLNEIVLRVRENMDHNFAENFMRDAESQYSFENFFVNSVTSYKDKKKTFLRNYKQEYDNNLVIIAFLAFNVFLGLLGTFWFRTQQRESEIAIRRVNGATTAQIFRRIISEGLLILLVITPIAWAIDYAIVAKELNHWYNGYFTLGRFTLTVLLVEALIAAMIVLGTLFPAMRAIKVQPAVALAAE